MKYIFPFLLAAVLISCQSAEIIQYQYKSTTMLGSRTVTITKDSVVTTYNGRTESNYDARATTEEEWKELQTAAADVKLNNVSELESPTNKRQTDAAPFGTLFFTTKDSTYKSASFDGYDSHETLKPVMSVIQKIARDVNVRD